MRLGMIGLAALLLSTPVAAHADPLVVTQDRATLLRLPRDADNVIIGNPAYFDVTVENPRLLVLFGKQLGQTNLMVLDARREPILSSAVVVLPDQENTSVHVWTPLRGSTGATETVYTCSASNCVQTKTGLTGGTVASGGGGGGGIGSAPPPEPPPMQPGAGASGNGGGTAQ